MLYIFDLDGTLIESYLAERTCTTCNGAKKVKDRVGWDDCYKCSGRGFTLENTGYDKLVWLPGRLDALKFIQQFDSQLAIATNQTGVVHGYQTEDEVDNKMLRVREELEREGVDLTTLAYCKSLDCRKPKPFMIDDILRRLVHPAWDAVFVGDMTSDEAAARAAGVPFVYADPFFNHVTNFLHDQLPPRPATAGG